MTLSELLHKVSFNEIAESVPVQRIMVRAYGAHQHYMRSLPLHPSQTELHACEDYADFELTLRPTYGFVMELLNYGAMILNEIYGQQCRILSNIEDCLWHESNLASVARR